MITTDHEANAFLPNSPMLRALLSDVNSYNCYEPLQYARTARTDMPLVSGDRFVTIGATRFSPNKVEVEVSTASVRGHVLMNQNFPPILHQ